MELLLKAFPLPFKFDMNGYVVIGITAALLFTFYKLPKRFPTSVTILIYIFNIFLVMSVDDVLAVEPYDLYDWMDSPKFEIMDIATYFLIYPPMGYFFLHFYDKYQFHGWKLFWYIVAWTAFSIGFEWVTVITEILRYKGWQLWYSLPVYVVVFFLELGFFRLLRKFYPTKESLKF